MQVHTFCQHVGSEDDVVVVLLLLPVGIEVLAYGLELLVAILGRDNHHIVAMDATRQIFYGINRF